ncbi:alpha/beta hydrolase [Paenibacillus sp. GCM10027627]|uniref:alpha/beta hydrolase n=1 Tax=unclassified Paenibacillus TaxID=185978 RepID=UPI00362A599C
MSENYALQKSGQGQAIVWLTGWSMPYDAFASLAAKLPDFHHFFVDFSDAVGPSDIREKALAATVAATKLSQSPPLIAGWSMGGLLALGLAANGLTKGLALFGATGRFLRADRDGELGWADGYVRRMLAGLRVDREGVERKFRDMLISDWERESGFGAKLPEGGSWSVEALEAGLHILRAENYLPMLPEIDCPVLLIHGSADRICPFGAAELLHRELPLSSFIQIFGGGHVPFLNRETELAGRIRDWWNEPKRNQHSATI